VTGSVITQTIGRTRVDLPMTATTMPPPATQAGASSMIETNDTRALESVWRDGLLDVAANTGCVPANDTATRACARLLQIATGSPAVTREVTIGGAPGEHLYFPSIRPDAAGDVAVVYTVSSLTRAPSVAAAVLDPAWSLMTPVQVRAGAGPYTGIDSSPYRWGDYSGAAVDPVDGSIWVAGEYGASSATGDWGTFIAQLTIAAGSATPTPSATAAASATPTPTQTPPPATSTATSTPTRTSTSSPTATATCSRGKAKHGRC
jgi:cell division septation protein DedD